MSQPGTVGLLIIIANCLFSYSGFENWNIFQRYKFQVGKIIVNKEYIRMLSSGFLHANWTHLLFNMFSFFSFAAILERSLGALYFSLIYFISLLAGNLFALIIHKNHPNYSAIGASGAVSGIIFAAIALFPDIRISLFFLPIGIPSWLFGLLYVGYTLYGIKSNNDNIGHEAHLGGAILGMITAIALYPNAIVENFVPIALTLIPTFVFLLLIFIKPGALFPGSSFYKEIRKQTIDDQYSEKKVMDHKEFDALLEKINKKGIDKLNDQEKKRLDELSKNQKK
ncbi:Membrane associated serine protease, rhomboid family [Tenacibaculum sp. MAR_2009_124]|uniref:rhomboid family intramembrane serine protease n=1 Tax=Tenacibaculum sp. MAR_2009_124 TaxID=1250059 RepID=UPI0008959258|nr:rhomboid family intramembrane serine protease [Tenacibaculum sp. MAR_2009_124]SEB72225.1 Membrane associated serine protease, rhomboid family [Tenacibaculum sp. MAR_2009_124]